SPPLSSPLPSTTLFRSTRTVARRRVSKLPSSCASVDCVISSGQARYLVAPCTRLARFTVFPSGPYLNLCSEPVLPTHALPVFRRSEEHTSELQSPDHLV